MDASDGECTGSDTVTVNVYNDSCQAAPAYQLPVGDLDGDRRVGDINPTRRQDT